MNIGFQKCTLKFFDGKLVVGRFVDLFTQNDIEIVKKKFNIFEKSFTEKYGNRIDLSKKVGDFCYGWVTNANQNSGISMILSFKTNLFCIIYMKDVGKSYNSQNDI